MKAYIFRHGDCHYKEGKVPLSVADDLTPEGVKTVSESALNLREEFGHELEGKVIWSSPFGRCLHSAKIINKKLKNAGINTGDIKISEELSEVRNLDTPTWQIFQTFARGGIVNYDSQNIKINPEDSNLFEYSATEYFRKDSIHNLIPDLRKKLPSKLLEKIDSVETHASALNRFNKFLGELKSDSILVAHEGPLGKYIEEAVRSLIKTPYLGRGKYFILKKSGLIWHPTFVQEGAIEYDRRN